jgi:hypothetical protein
MSAANPKSGPAVWLWIGLVAIASIALSRAFACATPFAALATLAAFTLRRRDAVALVLSVWLANQVVGFGLMHYPMRPSTFAWGAAIGAAALTALPTAAGVFRLRLPAAIGAPLALLAAYGAYEFVLFATSLLLSPGPGAFAPAVVARLFAINAVAFGALLCAERLLGGAVRGRSAALPKTNKADAAAAARA